MGVTTLAALGVFAAVAILAAVVVTLIMWESRTRRVPAGKCGDGMQLTPSTGPGFLSSFSTSAGRFMPWIIGITIVLGVIFAMYMLGDGGGYQKGKGPSIDWGFWIAAAAVLGLAAAAIWGKGGAPAKVALWAVAVGLLLFGGKGLDVWQKVQDNAASAVLNPSVGGNQKTTTSPAVTSAPAVTHHEASWGDSSKGDTLPVGVWSETFKIEVGCKTDYDAGNGTDFKVRYRFYSSEWKDHEPGTWPPANEVQFMLLRPRDQVPIKVTCS